MRRSPLYRSSSGRVVGASELLALHPGVDVSLRLRFRDARATLDDCDELTLAFDRRKVEVGQERPSLLGVLSVALFASQRIGPLATLKSEHDKSPPRNI